MVGLAIEFKHPLTHPQIKKMWEKKKYSTVFWNIAETKRYECQ